MYILFQTVFLAFGIKIDYVQEVLHYQGLGKLPFLKRGVAGVLLVQRNVVPVVDLAGLLCDGREGKGLDPDEVILLRYEGACCGVLAGQVRILRAGESRFPTKTGSESHSPLCREEMAVEEKTYAIIDIGNLFSHLGFAV